MLLRSPDAAYPYPGDIPDFKKRPPWLVRPYRGLRHDGVRFCVWGHFAYLADDGTAWDAAFAVNDAIGHRQDDPWQERSEGSDLRQEARAICPCSALQACAPGVPAPAVRSAITFRISIRDTGGLRLGLQGFLAATTNPNDDSLSAWLEWIDAPDVIDTGTTLSARFEITAHPVPEPSSYLTLLAGGAVLLMSTRRRLSNSGRTPVVHSPK